VLTQDLGQLGPLETGVTLVVSAASDVHHARKVDFRHRRMELSAGRVAYAVDRPRAALRLKRRVIRRMPIAGCEDQVEAVRQPADRLRDLVASRHREGAACREVVLEVDDQERFGQL
jgi:hypothetical protein